MARLTFWVLGFAAALGWLGLIFLVGSWLGSPPEEAPVAWVFLGLFVLVPVPLVAGAAWRRGDLRAHPRRASFAAGLATGGYLDLIGMFYWYFLPGLPGWIVGGVFFLVPVMVWPLMFRRPREPEPG